MSGYIWPFGGWQTTFQISTIQITADGAGCRTPSIRLHCGLRLKTPHITDTLPLSTAGSYCGPLSQTATPILCRATCTVSGMIWRLICSPYIKVNFRSMHLGLKNAEEKATQGMTRPLHKHSKKQAKSAKRRQKRNPEKGAQNHEDQIIPQGPVRNRLA